MDDMNGDTRGEHDPQVDRSTAADTDLAAESGASRRIVLVGNAPNEADTTELVDSADLVIRFNSARGFAGRNGSRTDQLWLINHGGQMAEWLRSGTLTSRPAVHAARLIVLPIPMLPGHVSSERAAGTESGEPPGTRPPIDPDRVNHLHGARERLTRAGHRVHALDLATYRAAQRALDECGTRRGEHYPSTGFIALHHAMRCDASRPRVDMVGFTFQGWRGHSWEAERRWVQTQVTRGRLTLHPVRAVGRRTPIHPDRSPAPRR